MSFAIIIGIVIVTVIVLVIMKFYTSKKDVSVNKNASINIDPETSNKAITAYDSQGKRLIYSCEMKDMNRVAREWNICDESLGTVGITENFTYSPNNVSLGDNGLKLSLTLGDTWNPTSTNSTSWGVKSGKVTGVKGVKFKYGIIEAKIKCPDLFGIWPAFWLNFSSGAFGTKYDNAGNPIGSEWKSLFEDYPFVSENFWPPEIDIMEHTHNVPIALDSQSSVHSPNQYIGYPFTNCKCGVCDKGGCKIQGWCPNGLDNSGGTKHTIGEGYCFGVSKFGSYPEGKLATSWHVYKADWGVNEVKFYMDDRYYGSVTNRDMILANNGALKPVYIPSVPMFPVINLALGEDWAERRLNDPYNFKTKDKLSLKDSSVMEIEYVRIYQDKDGSGINPGLTPDDIQTIFNNQILGREYHPWYNVNGFTVDQLNSVFNNVHKYLQDQYKDNYCIGYGAMSTWNNGGFINSESPTDIFNKNESIQKRADSALYYLLTRYGVGLKFTVVDGNLSVVKTMEPGLKFPQKILNSPFVQNYGWPPRPFNTKAPCEGTQTTWGEDISSLKCV